jgi:hypothetical protein
MADELLQLDKNSRVVLGAIDKDSEEIRYVGMDEDSRGLHVNQWVWDTGTSAWVRMTQPVVLADDLTVSMGDVEALLADHYYKRSKTYSYASGRIKYLAKNTDIDALEADVDWLVWKYSDADNADSEGPRTATSGVATVGAIDGLSWNI